MKRRSLSLAFAAALLAGAVAAPAQAACANVSACWDSAVQARTLALSLGSGPTCGSTDICVVAQGQQRIVVPLARADYRFEQVDLGEKKAPALAPTQAGRTLPALMIPDGHQARVLTPPSASTIAVLFHYDPGQLAPDTTYAILSLADTVVGQDTPFAIGLRNNAFVVGQKGPAGGYWRPLWDPEPLSPKPAWIALFVNIQADGKLLVSAYQPRPSTARPPVHLGAGLLDAGWPMSAYPAASGPKPYLPASNFVLGARTDPAGLGAPMLPGFSSLMVFGKALDPGERGAVMAQAMPVGAFMAPELDFNAPADNSGAYLKAYLPGAARTVRLTNRWRASPTASVLSLGKGVRPRETFSVFTPARDVAWYWFGSSRLPRPFALVGADPRYYKGAFLPEDLGLNTYRLRSWSGTLALTNLGDKLVMDTPAAQPTPAQTWLAYAPPTSGAPPSAPTERTGVTFMSALDGRIITLGPPAPPPPYDGRRSMVLRNPAELPDAATWTGVFDWR